MSRPRLLLAAATTGYQLRQFAAAADRIGVDLILATDRCHIMEDPWGDHAIPVRFENLEESAAALADANVSGVLGVADRPALLAALPAERAALPLHPSPALERCSNKHASRQRLAEAGLPVPEHW